uniref:Anaphase-promoting complex subunit 4 WD40 domain-containing protein n=1 Tax=Fibrocapsa japonica TaxID=94617 RepID=A0A7S2XTW7_9STRA|mmetsp:Transcript_11603/g.17146  ORF Transcript_11603/g.17146 Transcript_11603/m.17146 type:complete len:454 (+) Transcript_11603:64-1425(+)
MEDVALLLSSSEGQSSVVEIRPGTQISCFKNNTTVPNGTCTVKCRASFGGCGGGGEFAVSTQAKGLSLHVYRWGQPQPLYRCHTPEKITCLAASPDGMYLVGGAQSGQLCVWSLGTGMLVLSVEAHYRSTSAISFVEDVGVDVLVTGGEDALVHGWSLGQLLQRQHAMSYDRGATGGKLWTGADHSLAVGALCPLPGQGRVASASLDCTGKIWDAWSGCLLYSVTCPSGLRSVAADPNGSFVFFGSVRGPVYRVELEACAMSATAASAQAAGRSTLEGKSEKGGAEPRALVGHEAAVTSLAYSQSTNLLLSCSEDGTMRSWHVLTGQCLKTVRPQKEGGGGASGPLAQVLVVPRPYALSSHTSRTNEGVSTGMGARKGGRGKSGPAVAATPLQPLKKHRQESTGKSGEASCGDLSEFLDTGPVWVGQSSMVQQGLRTPCSCHFSSSAFLHWKR